MEIDEASKYIVDVFPANHAASTGVVYVQYINDHKHAVLEVIKEGIQRMKQKRNEEQLIVPFPDGPIFANITESIAPTVQTTTSTKQTEPVPGSKYSELLTATSYTARSNNKIPWAINVQAQSFRDVVVRQSTAPTDNSDNETATINSGNTSSKRTVRETELEKENEQLRAQARSYQMTIDKIKKDHETQRELDKKQQKETDEENNKKFEALNRAHQDSNNKVEKLMKMVQKLMENQEETILFGGESDNESNSNDSMATAEDRSEDTTTSKREGESENTPRRQKKS
jgi:hypothetical protein